MTWKKEVKFKCDNKYYLVYCNEKIEIEEKDVFIVKKLQNKSCTGNELVNLVMKKENSDEISAGFRMAEFVEKYGEWMEIGSEVDVIPV